MIKYLITLALLLSITIQPLSSEDLMSYFLTLYEDVVGLSKLGADVSDLVNDLSVALELINDGSPESLSRAQSLLKGIELRVESLKSRASYEVIYVNLIKYLTVAILASIPIATYYLLPRVYLGIWFRIRRRWVVRYGRT